MKRNKCNLIKSDKKNKKSGKNFNRFKSNLKINKCNNCAYKPKTYKDILENLIFNNCYGCIQSLNN